VFHLKKEYFALTHPQRRIWYNEKIYPHTSVHNVGGPVRIKGAIDFSLLEEAINYFIKNHVGVRIRLREDYGECFQYIEPYQYQPLELIDFSGFDEPEREYSEWLRAKSGKPFALLESPLYEFVRFQLAEDDRGYLVRFHHIIADGWSMNLLTAGIYSHYLRLKQGQAIAKEPASYLDYLSLEAGYIRSERFEKDRQFWKAQFTALPASFLIQDSADTRGRRKTVQLDAELSGRIKEFAANRQLSLNTFFTALMAIEWERFAQTEEIILGIPVLNRSGKKEKGIFGMFTSTMPFRIVLDERETIADFLIRLHEELLQSYFHQKYPYDLLAQELELKRQGYDSLFQVCVNYYNTKLITDWDGFAVQNTEFYNGHQIYAMQLVIKDWSDSNRLTLDIDYKTAVFSDERIDRMIGRLLRLADQMVNLPERKLAELELLDCSETNRLLYGFNATQTDYPRTKTIYQLFEEQAERTPERIAVRHEARCLTYAELNAKANQWASALRRKGVERGTAVALLATHSIETVIGILGILKAGGYYLPIDINYPVDRIAYLLEDSKARIALTNLTPDPALAAMVEWVDLAGPPLGETDADGLNLEPLSGPEDLAYVIYTSGSTGKPKGVMIEHRGLVNYIWWAQKVYLRGVDERFALYSSLAFDLTVTSIFTPLISGNQILIYQDDGSEFILYKIMRENLATVIKLTPSHLSLIKDLDNRGAVAQTFIVGGEDLKAGLAAEIQRSFGREVAIYNEYGPTETVVGCMIHRYDPQTDTSGSVPIGVPADNVQIYILDRNLRPVPEEAIGEIYISGDGVAKGYWNRPDLTAERFMADPFRPGGRMYKTGDLAKHRNDGKLVYLGRTDNQVKIRGHRIELGEIEQQLLTHPAIKDAVVIAIDNERHEKYLCAYAATKEEVAPEELRVHLSRNLPGVMIPQAFVFLAELPLTVNGKVNRGLLPAAVLQSEEPEFAAAENEPQERLIQIAAAVLNLGRVGLNDNFYHLGGDSIKAIQIAARLNDCGYKLKVKDVLANPVFREMAACLEVAAPNAAGDLGPVMGDIEPTPIVSWFLSRQFAEPHHYNQSVLLRLGSDVERGLLRQALQELTHRHDALRLNYDSTTGRLFYNIRHLEQPFPVQWFDLSADSPEMRRSKLQTLGQAMKGGINLERDRLFRAAGFDLGGDGRRLLLTAHHLVIDGVSWRILLEDLSVILEAITAGLPIPQARKTTSVQEWAAALGQYSKSLSVRDEVGYWQKTLEGVPAFPLEKRSGPDSYRFAAKTEFHLDMMETRELLAGANRAYRTEPWELVVAALAMALKDHAGLIDLLLELEGHGRSALLDRDLSKTVGWFTTIFPVRLMTTDTDLSIHIRSIKEQLRKVANQGFHYGILKYLTRSLTGVIPKGVRFNYLGEFDNSFDNRLFAVSATEDTGADIGADNEMTALIDINAMVIGEQLRIWLVYNKNRFSPGDIETLAQRWVNRLLEIIAHCRAKEASEFTPADFETLDLSQSELDTLFD
jgi:amino acid adenylation domain-containing protein/non-ribosomal peptide synthase protein (TIGR01720 family)